MIFRLGFLNFFFLEKRLLQQSIGPIFSILMLFIGLFHLQSHYQVLSILLDVYNLLVQFICIGSNAHFCRLSPNHLCFSVLGSKLCFNVVLLYFTLLTLSSVRFCLSFVHDLCSSVYIMLSQVFAVSIRKSKLWQCINHNIHAL